MVSEKNAYKPKPETLVVFIHNTYSNMTYH